MSPSREAYEHLLDIVPMSDSDPQTDWDAALGDIHQRGLSLDVYVLARTEAGVGGHFISNSWIFDNQDKDELLEFCRKVARLNQPDDQS